MNKTLFILILMLVSSVVLSGGVYKKVGPDGKVTYTDVPPGNFEEAEVNVKVHEPTPDQLNTYTRNMSGNEQLMDERKAKERAMGRAQQQWEDEDRMNEAHRQAMAPRVCTWVGDRYSGREVCNK